ncbi:MAG: nuclear transport factor 2 family protein [Nitrospirota bacterium]
MAELDTVREHRAVFLANQRFYTAFEHLNIREMDVVWLHDERVQCIHPGWPRLAGWPAIRDSWVRIFNNTRSMVFQIAEPRIAVQGSIAWVVCVERITALVDETPQETQVLATNVFVRRAENSNGLEPAEADRWLMVHHHGSPIFHRLAERDDAAEQEGSL